MIAEQSALAAEQAFLKQFSVKLLAQADIALAMRVREQWQLWQEMRITGSDEDIAEHSAAMVRGWEAASEACRDHLREEFKWRMEGLR